MKRDFKTPFKTSLTVQIRALSEYLDENKSSFLKQKQFIDQVTFMTKKIDKI